MALFIPSAGVGPPGPAGPDGTFAVSEFGQMQQNAGVVGGPLSVLPPATQTQLTLDALPGDSSANIDVNNGNFLEVNAETTYLCTFTIVLNLPFASPPTAPLNVFFAINGVATTIGTHQLIYTVADREQSIGAAGHLSFAAGDDLSIEAVTAVPTIVFVQVTQVQLQVWQVVP